MSISRKEAEEMANLLQLLMASIELDTCCSDRSQPRSGCTLGVSKEYVRKLTDYINVHTVRAEPR